MNIHKILALPLLIVAIIVVGACSQAAPEAAEANPEQLIEIPWKKIAADIGGGAFLNTIAVGMLAALFKIETEFVESYIAEYFHGKTPEVVKKNIQAMQQGYDIG